MDALSDARRKLDELVAEGFKAFQGGRYQEAALIADGALAEDPGCVAALSLKGMCQERAGEIAAALESFEKVLEANPDSALDRIKVTHLRRVLSHGLASSAPPDKKTAVVGALAAVVLVVAAGVALAGFMNSGNKDQAAQKQSTTQPLVQPFESNPKAPSGDRSPEEATDGSMPGPRTGATDGKSSAGSPGPQVPSSTGGVLPRVDAGAAPLQVPIQGPIGVQPEATPTRTSGAPTAPEGNGRTVEGPDPDIGPPASSQAPSTGYIDIRVSNRPPSSGGSVEAPDANRAEALVRSAQQQFLLGNFDSAARMYEQALKAGASPARTNQRLGQCYERLHRKADALSAYTRAASAYEAAIASGAATSSNQAGLEACRQAISMLKGGQ